tara:strand:- start:176 stop:943 length:768 start_codon:yes stop_codon:yes gene_type:complete
MHWLSLWNQCVGDYWDEIYDLRGSLLTGFLLSRRRTVGRYRNINQHRVEEIADLVEISPPPEPRLWLSETAVLEANKLIPADVPVFAIGPTANWGGKRWPIERFADLALRAIGKNGVLPNAKVAVLGTEEERSTAEHILQIIPTGSRIDLIGKPLDLAAACIANARLFAGNDSGLMHIAAATGTPTLGLFGPSPERRYGPWGIHCMSVRTRETYEELVNAPEFNYRSQDSLMKSLTVEMAYDALFALCRKVNISS